MEATSNSLSCLPPPWQASKAPRAEHRRQGIMQYSKDAQTKYLSGKQESVVAHLAYLVFDHLSEKLPFRTTRWSDWTVGTLWGAHFGSRVSVDAICARTN